MSNKDMIINFLDNNGKLRSFPSKRKMKIYALAFLAEKIVPDKQYTEKEFNELLNDWHTFNDPATLRRELYDNKFIDRDGFGKVYAKSKIQPEIEELVKKYG